MQRAKVFFYVCGGVLALTLAFLSGATFARGQAANQVAVGGLDFEPSVTQPRAAAIDQQGQIWVWENGCGDPKGPFAPPKSGHIVAVNIADCPNFLVMYDDGDIYLGQDLMANIFTTGTPVRQSTLGRLKADRR